MLTLIFVLLSITIGLFFCFQNLVGVPVKLFSWHFNLYPGIIAVFGLILGLYLAKIWYSITNINSRKIFKAFSEKIIEMEKEIQELKKNKV